MANTQERSRTRRERVLAAALEVFTTHGYSDAAIDEVARASDTSKGGLYFHFPSKQALFLALLDEASATLSQRVTTAMAAESEPIARGETALREVLHAFAGHRSLARLLLIDALGAGKEFNAKLNELHEAFTNLIAGCLDDAVTQGDLPPCDTRIAAQAWYGAVNHVVLSWLMTGEPRNLEDAYPPLRRLLLYGLMEPARDETQ